MISSKITSQFLSHKTLLKRSVYKRHCDTVQVSDYPHPILTADIPGTHECLPGKPLCSLR